ncbi:hypothetical protein FE257_007012 [Aspergillus nanangensis]|uniref:Luciferase domain-containing protein n=1 Tax=Aspergillus nanangensis TaxID=2582783 RepID=A0AAD4GUH2_ASPNN|nr:hypothetical protein FE257_007012 [Aspergillus nanangensis]
MNMTTTTNTSPSPTLLPLILLTSTLILSVLLFRLLRLTLRLILQDYHAFLALGPGGTPSTPRGYLQISLLRLFALRNPLIPPRLPAPTSPVPQTGLLSTIPIPRRHGPRPTVAGIAPHRQTTQIPPGGMYTALTAAITSLCAKHPSTLYAGTSCFEKHSTGIFCRGGCGGGGGGSKSPRRTCNGEVVHGHPSDGSMHLTLHPADVRVVLEMGWGERHPLAREKWWLGKRSVPAGFVMVYAPRDGEELAVVMQVIRAAVWWVSGLELEEYHSSS